jgi:hypothetical protein
MWSLPDIQRLNAEAASDTARKKTSRWVCSARNLVRRSFSHPSSRYFLESVFVMQTANRPERRFLSLDDLTECGDLNFVAPECPLRVPEFLGPGSSEGGLGCNE